MFFFIFSLLSLLLLLLLLLLPQLLFNIILLSVSTSQFVSAGHICVPVCSVWFFLTLPPHPPKLIRALVPKSHNCEINLSHSVPVSLFAPVFLCLSARVLVYVRACAPARSRAPVCVSVCVCVTQNDCVCRFVYCALVSACARL